MHFRLLIKLGVCFQLKFYEYQNALRNSLELARPILDSKRKKSVWHFTLFAEKVTELRLTKKAQVCVQSFNIMATGEDSG